MTSGLRRAAPTIVLAFLAALAGMLIGDKVMSSREHRGTEIHTLLHRRLTLDATQERQLEVLETRFAVTRATFDAQLRADNASLARAIEREHGYGPAVAAAVDRSHATMGALQKATLAHVFAMRQLMRPDQAATFDHVVARALTAAP